MSEFNASYIISGLAIIGPVVSAVLVALLNNWDKVNTSKKTMKSVATKLDKVEKNVNATSCQLNHIERDVRETMESLGLLEISLARTTSAQRAMLQSIILEDCKLIQSRLNDNRYLIEEKLKQLIILFKEYYICGFNSQAKLYFDETIELAAEVDNVLVRTLMNHYFPEYNPHINKK